jgi:hypothetical protein
MSQYLSLFTYLFIYLFIPYSFLPSFVSFVSWVHSSSLFTSCHIKKVGSNADAFELRSGGAQSESLPQVFVAFLSPSVLMPGYYLELD